MLNQFKIESLGDIILYQLFQLSMLGSCRFCIKFNLALFTSTFTYIDRYGTNEIIEKPQTNIFVIVTLNYFSKHCFVIEVFQSVADFWSALMAVLSLTASCLSPLPRACEKVASDLGLGGGFLWVLLFHPPLTTG